MRACDSWLRNAAGATVYAGNSNINGYNYNIAASSFSNNVYNWQQTQLAQGADAGIGAGRRFRLGVRSPAVTIISTTSSACRPRALPGRLHRRRGHHQPHERHRLVHAGCQWRVAWLGGPRNFLRRCIAMPKPLRRPATAWPTGSPARRASVVNAARGRTATNAVWLQDIWTLLPDLKAALGVRYEDWRAYDGIEFFRLAGAECQPAAASPPAPCRPRRRWPGRFPSSWKMTGSWGMAYRMPTVTELYQAITTGTVLTVPNPNLKPEQASSYELAAEHQTDNGLVRAVAVRGRHQPTRCCRSRRRWCPARPPCSAMCRMWTAPGCAAWNWWSISMMSSFPGLELMGSLTAADGRIGKDTAFAAAVDKFIPQRAQAARQCGGDLPAG